MRRRATVTGVLMILALMGPLAYAASVKVTGVEFLPNKTVAIPLMAQKNAPQAELSAEVQFKLGQSQIKLKYKNLKPAVLYGGDVTAYVLWAVTSDGRAFNLGQVQQGGKNSGTEKFYVALKGFAMVITAEPYYLVARPSEMVMFVGGAPKKDKSRSQDYNFTGLARAPKHDVENIDSLAWDAKTDFVLLQATRAYDLAGRYQAKNYASEHFRMAGSELTAAQNLAEAEKKLSGILLVFHKATVIIEGYTDSTGSSDYNLRLSKQRAESVESFLTQEGVAEGRLESAGYGSGNPVADNSTEDGRAANRRVELVIVTGQN